MNAVLGWLPYFSVGCAAVGVTLVTAPWSSIHIHHEKKEHHK
jgi:hypothetical protein